MTQVTCVSITIWQLYFTRNKIDYPLTNFPKTSRIKSDVYGIAQYKDIQQGSAPG